MPRGERSALAEDAIEPERGGISPLPTGRVSKSGLTEWHSKSASHSDSVASGQQLLVSCSAGAGHSRAESRSHGAPDQLGYKSLPFESCQFYRVTASETAILTWLVAAGQPLRWSRPLRISDILIGSAESVSAALTWNQSPRVSRFEFGISSQLSNCRAGGWPVQPQDSGFVSARAAQGPAPSESVTPGVRLSQPL